MWLAFKKAVFMASAIGRRAEAGEGGGWHRQKRVAGGTGRRGQRVAGGTGRRAEGRG